MIIDRKRTFYTYELIPSTLGEIGVVTGSATRKPRLLGGDEGRNKKQTASLPGSPALWAGSFKYADGSRSRIRRILLPEDGVSMADRIRQEFPGALPAAARGEIARLLENFLGGKEVDFSAVDLDLDGMKGFVRRTLTACREIPRGRVVTYGGLAAALGAPGAARAVGNAMGSNPFALIIPCHRVIRSGGGLGGFGGGGPAMKRRLLEQEGVVFDAQGRIRPEHLIGKR
ncbi:MAG: methylated-DNA--[protein]-cysteine S-methyltransferase [Deltaproteobacteria bacterium]|nr:methylated-DNA--[protein]-cysteine S-methyltransferase [Deltaproteobacteria bacterium]